MSDCHALRLLAERAADCDQALEIMRELVGRSDAGYGGYQRGMIFVLTDARGKAILVETTMSKIAWRWIESGKYVITNHYRIPEIRDLAPEELMGGFMVKHTKVRFERGRELLSKTGRIGLEEMMRFARDPENPPWHICNAGERLPFKTVSGFICRTEPSKDPQSWIANGCPTEVPFQRWGWNGIEGTER